MKLTLTQFIKKYQGTKVDFDGKFGPQCVDLVRQYFKEVWEIEQPPAVTGAADLFKVSTSLRHTTDSALADYSVGDVLIWGSTISNRYGHVAILVAVYNTKNFIVFEQDGFKQDGAKLVMRSRENLIGALWNEL